MFFGHVFFLFCVRQSAAKVNYKCKASKKSFFTRHCGANDCASDFDMLNFVFDSFE